MKLSFKIFSCWFLPKLGRYPINQLYDHCSKKQSGIHPKDCVSRFFFTFSSKKMLMIRKSIAVKKKISASNLACFLFMAYNFVLCLATNCQPCFVFNHTCNTCKFKWSAFPFSVASIFVWLLLLAQFAPVFQPTLSLSIL